MSQVSTPSQAIIYALICPKCLDGMVLKERVVKYFENDAGWCSECGTKKEIKKFVEVIPSGSG